MPDVPTYGYSVRARDPHGLDPSIYRVHIGVARLDGEALTDDEIETIRAALEPRRAPADEPPDGAQR